VNAAAPSDVLDSDVSHLLQAESDLRIRSNRTCNYLRWRYGLASGLGYRAVSEVVGGRLAGVAVFRVRPRGELWETTISELLVPEGEVAAAKSLVSQVVEAARVDYVVGHFSDSRTADRAAGARGFFPTPAGIEFVVNSLGDAGLDPRSLSSWGLSLGDLEVF
jgi:hypothetical protein